MNKYIVIAKGKHIAIFNDFIGIFAALSSYICIIPLVVTDIFLWQFQNIYFRILEIPLVERKKYVVIDRYKL
jgi:hypothetical protein